MGTIKISRSGVRLQPDPLRRISKPYVPGHETPGIQDTRIEGVIRRVLTLGEDDVSRTLMGLRMQFSDRSSHLDEVFRLGFASVGSTVPDPEALSDDQRLLIGAYFAHEYSIEAAALTNPSMTPHPDQTGTPNGSLRIIVALRSIGEGHLSSIEFRTGLVDSAGEIEIDPPGECMIGKKRPSTFDKQLFVDKLNEMGEDGDLLARTLRHLGATFTKVDMDLALAELGNGDVPSATREQFIHAARWVASSNYEVVFPEESELSQRVLFPSGPNESRGMEDARLVRFVDPDGSARYYATYTAFDGFSILPQLISTTDFESFRISTLNGRGATNKGMALFPRLIGGRFAALARSDGESNFLMMSDDVRYWNQSTRIPAPLRPWDLLQVGNAGPPIETDAGWLVLTHGVGPMRRYALGAMLLDIDDPTQVIGDLHEPLLEPDEDERDGYVPNVVYSCGAVIHEGHLVIPYGASDTSTRFATVDVDELLSELTSSSAR